MMLVFGDQERIETVEQKRTSILAALEAAARRETSGLAGHSALAGAFIELSELVQGLADAEFALRDCDERSTLQDEGMALLVGIAGVLARSWRSGFQQVRDLLPDGFAAALTRITAPGASRSLRTKTAEGYAFYALYPESHLEAAARTGLEAEPRVISVRSIGVGLAAIVAAWLRATPS